MSGDGPEGVEGLSASKNGCSSGCPAPHADVLTLPDGAAQHVDPAYGDVNAVRRKLSSPDAEISQFGAIELRHRLALQRRAFGGALVIATFLMLGSLTMASVAMTLYALHEHFDWHAAWLVGALVAPATFIVITTLRATFPKQPPSPRQVDAGEAASDSNGLQLLKQLKGLLDDVKREP